ncbi:MAG: hypothetical protein Kow0026_28850 [Oricola sp.]
MQSGGETGTTASDGGAVYDAIVLGCGVSGLIIARTLTDQGHTVLCVDEYGHAGGNHITDIVEGMEFDIGSIYFHERDLQFRYFPELGDACIEKPVKLVKIGRNGRFAPYPFSFRHDVLDRGAAFLARSVASWAADRARVLRVRSASDRIRRKLGLFFFRESGLYSYMQRLFGLVPEDTSLTLVHRRMQWIINYSPTRILLDRILRIFAETREEQPVNRTLFRPPGGFAAYYDIAANRLRADGADIVTGERLETVAGPENGTFSVTGRSGACYRGRRLITTLPIWRICDLTGRTRPALSGITLQTLRVAFRGDCRTDGDILFNFHPGGPWKRITVMSAIYGKVNGWNYMSVECPFADDPVPAGEAVFADFERHVRSLGIFDGELRYLGCRELREAYPRLAIGYEREQQRILNDLASRGIESAGRQGLFDYIPHSAVAAEMIRKRFGRPAAKASVEG